VRSDRLLEGTPRHPHLVIAHVWLAPQEQLHGTVQRSHLEMVQGAWILPRASMHGQRAQLEGIAGLMGSAIRRSAQHVGPKADKSAGSLLPRAPRAGRPEALAASRASAAGRGRLGPCRSAASASAGSAATWSNQRARCASVPALRSLSHCSVPARGPARQSATRCYTVACCRMTVRMTGAGALSLRVAMHSSELR
jgi:hypothetical protein